MTFLRNEMGNKSNSRPVVLEHRHALRGGDKGSRERREQQERELLEQVEQLERREWRARREEQEQLHHLRRECQEREELGRLPQLERRPQQEREELERGRQLKRRERQEREEQESLEQLERRKGSWWENWLSSGDEPSESFRIRRDQLPRIRRTAVDTLLPQSNYSRFGVCYRLLRQKSLYWESYRILRSVLPLLGDSHGRYNSNDCSFENFFHIEEIFQLSDRFFDLKDIPIDDEQLLLTEFANASLLSVFLNTSTQVGPLLTARSQFYEKAKTLASTILSECPHLVNSRPYLEWMLREGAQGSQRDVQFKFAAIGRRMEPDLWSLSPTSRWQFLQERNTNAASTPTQNKPTKELLSMQPQQALGNIAASAKLLGDYQLQKIVLQQSYQQYPDFNKGFQTLTELASLQRDTMEDAPGYLESLIENYVLVEYFEPANLQVLREGLCNQFSKFDSSFPFSADSNPSMRRNTKMTFWDMPLLKWVERSVQHSLLKGIGREVEAELAKVQLANIERHLPSSFASAMDNLARCHGCVDCGREDTVGFVPRRRMPSRQVYPHVPAPANQHDVGRYPPYPREQAFLDPQTELEIEREIASSKRMEDQLKDQLKDAARFRRAREAKREIPGIVRTAGTTKPKKPITLKDARGRKFMLPFELCSSWKVSPRRPTPSPSLQKEIANLRNGF